MSAVQKAVRFAHSEGHTDLCFDESGSHLFTCGADGDVRVWTGIDDDDAESHRVGDKVLAIAFGGNRFFTGTDSNDIQANTFPDGCPDGTIARFTAPVSQICLNKDATKLIAGACDFSIKMISLTNLEYQMFEGHQAPVLSIAIDPKEDYLASSSCDGTIKVWRLSNQQCLKSIILLEKCSDISLSKTLCRMDWEPKTGKYIAFPIGCEIRLYERESWENLRFFSDTYVKSNISIACFSPCGKYIAGGCFDGAILIWSVESRKCLLREKHPKNLTICALKWNPKGNNEIVYCDTEGQFGTLEDIKFLSDDDDEAEGGLTAEQYANLFDDDVDMGPSSKVDDLPGNDDDIDDASDIIQRLKYEVNEDSNDVDSLFKPTEEAQNDEKIQEIVKVVQGYTPTPLQRPFHPSSTPIALSQRFMVWNSVGVIRQYTTEEENSIDIEFHDTATHHAMHLTNDLGHSMADISTEAVIMACVSDEETLSKLVCLHFSSWDNSKEWSVTMPKGEEIQCITLGNGWLAVGTDKRQLRLYTISGIQQQIFSLPGPVVTMAGWQSNLIVVYHMGQGVPGDQCLGFKLIQLCQYNSKRMNDSESLPISPKSTLSWIGFSSEGTAFTFDSSGIMRMFNKKFGSTWIQVASTKDHTKSRSDHYWIVGVVENPQQIQCIPCKGSTYPPVLPRPAVMIIPFQIPLCEMETEKSQLEENFWRSRLFNNHLDDWTSIGLDEEVVAMRRASAETTERECLMKIFALSCKSDRGYRASETCQMMPDQKTVQLAIKYASRLRHLALAQRISEIAKQKAEEEEVRLFGDKCETDQEDFQTRINPSSSNSYASRESTNDYTCDIPQNSVDNATAEAGDDEDPEDEDSDNGPTSPRLMTKENADLPLRNPFSQNVPRKNPFKMATQKEASSRGTSVFDNIQKQEKRGSSKNVFGNQITLANKKVFVEKKKGSQTKIFASKSKDTAVSTKDEENESITQKKPVSAFQLWHDENRLTLENDNPDVSADDLTKVAAQRFRQLDKDIRKTWMDKAKTMNSSKPLKDDENKKRKRETIFHNVENQALSEHTEDDQPKKKIKDNEVKKTPLSQNTNSKLSGFAFSKS